MFRLIIICLFLILLSSFRGYNMTMPAGFMSGGTGTSGVAAARGYDDTWEYDYTGGEGWYQPPQPDSGWFNSSGQYPNQARAWNRPMPGYFGSLPSSFGTQLSPAALAVLQSFFPAFNANAPTKTYEKTPAEKEVYSTSDEKDPTRTLLSPAQPATFGTTTTQMPELYSAQKMKQAQSMGAWEALMSYLGDVIGKQAKENWIQQSMAAGPSANKQRQPGWNVAKQR